MPAARRAAMSELSWPTEVEPEAANCALKDECPCDAGLGGGVIFDATLVAASSDSRAPGGKRDCWAVG